MRPRRTSPPWRPGRAPCGFVIDAFACRIARWRAATSMTTKLHWRSTPGRAVAKGYPTYPGWCTTAMPDRNTPPSRLPNAWSRLVSRPRRLGRRYPGQRPAETEFGLFMTELIHYGQHEHSPTLESQQPESPDSPERFISCDPRLSTPLSLPIALRVKHTRRPWTTLSSNSS